MLHLVYIMFMTIKRRQECPFSPIRPAFSSFEVVLLDPGQIEPCCTIID